MAKWQNFVGAAMLDELSTTAEESVTEESASEEPDVTTADEPKPSITAEDAGVESCDGATDEESSSQPSTKTQPITEAAHKKFLNLFFIKDLLFFSIK
jgi:hypothetical protein